MRAKFRKFLYADSNLSILIRSNPEFWRAMPNFDKYLHYILEYAEHESSVESINAILDVSIGVKTLIETTLTNEILNKEFTPLQTAICSNAHSKVIKTLLHHGADPNNTTLCGDDRHRNRLNNGSEQSQP